MKRWLILLFATLCAFLLPLSASAESADEVYQEQAEASGADDLFSTLPKETQDLLRSIGIHELEVEGYTALQPTALLETLLSLFGQQAGGVAANCGVVLGIVILGAVAEGMRQTLQNPRMAEMFKLICAVASCGAVLMPVAECIQRVFEAADGVTVLMLSFVPAYGALILAGGHATLAASYNTVLLTGAECVAQLATGVCLPLLSVSLGLSATGTLFEKNRLGHVSGSLSKLSVWILATVTGLFTGLLSMQSLVASSADSLGQRAARMSISSFVPVVGGALSEAFGTVTGCLKLLRSTLGMFGVAASAFLVLPSFFLCLSWSMAIGLCRMAAEVLSVANIAGFLGTVQTILKALMGVLAACALFMIVTTTLITLAGG